MKNINKNLLVITALSVIVLACQKERICECTLVEKDTSRTSVKTDTAKMSKKDAENWCNTHGAGSKYETTCVLK